METDKPWITTIIPTYNRPTSLKRSIESVLNQTYPNVLACVYIDGSGEETMQVVEELAKKDPRVKFHRHSKNIGSRPNFQYGLEQVKTPYFCFLSDDDYLFPCFFETAMEAFKAYPDIGFSSCPYIFVTTDNQIMWATNQIKESRVYYPVPEGLYNIGKDVFGWSGTVFKKESADSIGKLDIEMGAIDIDYLTRFAARFSYVITNKPAAFFVTHSTSDSFLLAEDLFWPGWQMIIDKIKKEPNLTYEVKKQTEMYFMNFLRNWLFYSSIHSLRINNFIKTLKLFKMIKEIYPNDKKLSLYVVMVKLLLITPWAHKFFLIVYNFRNWLRDRLKEKNPTQRQTAHDRYKEYLTMLPKAEI